MKLSHLISIAAILLVFICCKFNAHDGSSIKLQKADNDFSIEYFSPTQKITIRHYEIVLTEVKEEYDNPISAIPSKRVEVTKKGKLSRSAHDSLLSLIKSNGFMSLKKSIYGAGEGERFYPYTLTVKNKNKEKKVLFRSNPSAPSAPKEFSEIEVALQKIVKSINHWEEIKGSISGD
jgi:hypothetical protein